MRRESKNEIKQTTDGDDVGRLIGELKPAEAPPNFERAVMTRIAEAVPAPRGVFGMSPALAYSLPLVLIVLVGFAVFLATRQTASQQPEVAGQSRSQFTSNETPAPAVATPSVEQTAVAVSPPTDRKAAPTSQTPPPINSSTRKQAQRPGGGSIDEAVNEKRAVAPAGDQSRTYSANRDEVVSSTAVPAREMLLQLGMTVDFSGGWVVRRVAANSQAEHSGVKSGDIVVALGDMTLNANTEFKGQFSAASIRVRRGGQELNLILK